MTEPVIPSSAALAGVPLEDTLAAVELRLAELGNALRERDPAAIDRQADELHRALARAVDHFAQATRNGRVPAGMRHRLAHASGQVAAQRESFARATAALDRAIDVLMPRDMGTLYSPQGSTDRGLRGGVIQA